MLPRNCVFKSKSGHKALSSASFDTAEMFRSSMFGDNAGFGYQPRQIDLRRWMPSIANQEYMNTCSSSAFASACEYLIRRRGGASLAISRLFIYFNGQIIDQRTHSVEDSGASRKNVVVGMRKYGFCREEFWPYDRRLLNKKPPPEVYAMARQYTITPLRIPINVNAIRMCLANHLPAVVAVKLRYEINGEANYNGGYITVPDANDRDISYLNSHALLLVGYDDDSEHFIARNSWGRDWGDNGYCYLPYQYILDERLVNYPDYLWAITQILPRMDMAALARNLDTMRHFCDSQRRRPRGKKRSTSCVFIPTRKNLPVNQPALPHASSTASAHRKSRDMHDRRSDAARPRKT